MQNMFLYYKYINRIQFLLKYPQKQENTVDKSWLKKILFEIFFDDLKNNYYIYIYHIALLIRLILNKSLYLNKVQKNFKINKIYMGLILKGTHMYQFLDVFASILLPLFESFNVTLDLQKFDIFGNLTYRLLYCDPVFMSKNTVTVWSSLYHLNVKFCFFNIESNLNCSILQQFNLNWYF